MNIILGDNISYNFINLDINKYMFGREAYIIIPDKETTINRYDEIIIEDENGKVLIDGKVYNINQEDGLYKIKASTIFHDSLNTLKNDNDEETQIEKNQALPNILKNLISEDIVVKGNNTSKIENITWTIGDEESPLLFLKNIFGLYCNTYLTDHKNTLELNPEVQSSDLIIDDTLFDIDDKIVYVNRPVFYKKFTMIGNEFKGSYEGEEGEQEYKQKIDLDFTQSELECIAEHNYKTYLKNLKFYICYVPIDTDLNVNYKYLIKDDINKVDEEMVVKKLTYHSDLNKDRQYIKVEFEQIV